MIIPLAFQNCSRYMQLEGLEQLPNTDYGLEHINDAKELGLSIDGGLD